MKKTFTLTVLTFIIFTFLASDVFAIPAFARKYNMTCKTCHSPFPSLKAYGDEFAGNGFQLKDKDAPRYYVDTGDEELSLIRDLPLALRFEGYVTYNIRNSDLTDFTAPWLLKLLSGGAITKDIAYYFYFFFSERGDVAGVEDAFLMFNDLFGSELDFTIGQFQVCDPLFKRELRLTRDDYYIYKVKPGYSYADLTYDRGIMLSYGFESGTDVALEVINGTGIDYTFSGGNFDNDNYKNLFLRISQNAGDYFRIGGLGYYGNEERRTLRQPFISKNELWMLGGDATVSFDPLELNLQYIERKDDNPSFDDPRYLNEYSKTIKTRGAFSELIFRPEGDESDWYGVALFNWIESNQSDLNLKQLGVHFGYLLRRNIRLVAEYSQNFTAKYGTIGLGFVTAF